MSKKIRFFFGKIITPFQELKNQILVVSNSTILDILPYSKIESFDYDFSSYIAYPTFVNAHDHLLGSYYPKVGPRRPYINWKPWDDDLKSSKVYAERGNIQNIDLYYLGSYKNLLSGALTVSDHIPHVVNDLFIDKMPIRIIKNYSVAHEISSFELKWGEDFTIEHQRAIEKNQPFITHIEEGFDEETLKGIDYLLEKNCLTEYTVLVHGIGLSMQDIKSIAENKAHFVWCPASNTFMFNCTTKIKEIINSGINVSIGTDSPMSGSLNILQEIKFAKYIYYQNYKEVLDDKTILKMITINPARAFRLDHMLGSLEKKKKAEFILLKENKEKNPYTQIVEADLEDIEFIFYEGKPLYASEDFKPIFKDFQLQSHSFKLFDKVRIIRDSNPLDVLDRVRKAVGFKKQLPFFPIN